jgi:hypothetical protein
MRGGPAGVVARNAEGGLTVLLTILLVVLVLMLLGSAPVYGTAGGWHGYGWGPSGLVGLLLVVLLVLLLVHAI